MVYFAINYICGDILPWGFLSRRVHRMKMFVLILEVVWHLKKIIGYYINMKLNYGTVYMIKSPCTVILGEAHIAYLFN